MVTPENLGKAHQIILGNRKVKLNEIDVILKISHGKIFCIDYLEKGKPISSTSEYQLLRIIESIEQENCGKEASNEVETSGFPPR